jgi:hypothetical protein
MENIKIFLKEDRINVKIRNLVKVAMIIAEDNMSFTDLVIEIIECVSE